MARPKVVYSTNHASDIAKSLERERSDLEPSDYLYLLYAERFGRVLDTVFDKFCRGRFAISGSDMRVILALRRAGPSYALRPTELFRSLLVTSGAITKQVDRLVAAGFVERQNGPHGSGGFLIHLTEKGFAAADKVLTSLTDGSVIPEAMLSDVERRTVTKLLGQMLEALENIEDEDFA